MKQRWDLWAEEQAIRPIKLDYTRFANLFDGKVLVGEFCLTLVSDM